jgi:polyphenol oxidase
MVIAQKHDAELRKIDELLAEGGVRRSGPRRTPFRTGKKVRSGDETESPKKMQKAVRGNKLEVLRAPVSRGTGFGADWLVHGFSSRMGGRTTVYRPGIRTGGDLNLGLTPHDDAATVTANRKIFVSAVYGADDLPELVTLKQIHSAVIHRVKSGGRVESGESLAKPAVLKGDGLMTDAPGVLLAIQTADCIPVLVADMKNRAVAAFHAGWRGTLRRIVEHGVGRMRLEFGSRPQDLVAAIGPGIGFCCYAVGEEVRHEFYSQFAYAEELFREVSDSNPIREKYPLLFLTARAPGHSNLGPSLHLDLAEANRRQLLDAGLQPASVHLVGQCTGCHTDRFFSHRTEQGFTGRMMSVIGIRP